MGVTVTIGACGTICCCAVWLIDPLIQGMRVLALTRRLVHAACSFVQGLSRHSLSADRVSVAGPSAARTGATLQSRNRDVRGEQAETRASIAQNLEGGSEGARDRVVTGRHLC